jgi:GntR family transcriptional regulator / MocR family aminotransferase
LKEKHLTGGALAPSIGLYGISAFYMNRPTHEGLIFGYGGIESDDIDTAMKKLKMRLSKMA